MKFKWDPPSANQEVRHALTAYRSKLRELSRRGVGDEGLEAHLTELCQSLSAAMGIVVGGAWTALSVWKGLDKTRRLGNTEKEKQDAEALLGGFTGDPVIEINSHMYNLARKLPANIWIQYDGNLAELGRRIERNGRGEVTDLPANFVKSWNAFMENYGFDGKDQLFVSSPRYHEQPELLLAKIRHYVSSSAKDPAAILVERRAKRQEVQRQQLAAAGCCSRRTIRTRNTYLDQVIKVETALPVALGFGRAFDIT